MNPTLWEEQQEKTFLDWANYYLKINNMITYGDLDELLEKDGILYLIETIFSKPLFKNKETTSPFIKLENYNKALTILGQPFGVIALNIVFNRDSKMTVSLLWHIIQKYNLSRFSELDDGGKFAVYEYNDPVEPIQYWENDIDENEDMDQSSIDMNGVTLNQAVDEWIQKTCVAKNMDPQLVVTLDDMLYCTGDEDERLGNFAKFVSYFSEIPVTIKEISQALKDNPSMKVVIEKYCLLQQALKDSINAPLMSIVYNVEIDKENEENEAKLFNLNEQSFLAYLCSVRDCLFRKDLEDKGEDDVPPPLPEYEIENNEGSQELINEVDRKLMAGSLADGTNSSDPLALSFEEFVNYLEAELRPLAYKLKNSYDIMITRINQHLSMLKMQEEQRKQRDAQRRERMKLRLLLKKQKLESETKRVQLEYEMKKKEKENRIAYLKRKEELRITERKIKEEAKRAESTQYEEFENLKIKKHTKKREVKPHRAQKTKTVTTRHEHVETYESGSTRGGHLEEDTSGSGEEIVKVSKKVIKLRGKCKRCEVKLKSDMIEDEYEDHEKFEKVASQEIPYIGGECTQCHGKVKMRLRRVEHVQNFSSASKTSSSSHSKSEHSHQTGYSRGLQGKEKRKVDLSTVYSGLKVTIFGCKDLRSKHFLGKSASPFVIVNFLDQLKKTKVKPETLAPTFNTTFLYTFKNNFVEESALNISVRDSIGNKYLGSKEFRLREILSLTKEGTIKYKGLFELANSKGALIGIGYEFIKE